MVAVVGSGRHDSSLQLSSAMAIAGSLISLTLAFGAVSSGHYNPTTSSCSGDGESRLDCQQAGRAVRRRTLVDSCHRFNADRSIANPAVATGLLDTPRSTSLVALSTFVVVQIVGGGALPLGPYRSSTPTKAPLKQAAKSDRRSAAAM
ncbi:hypothetical protein LJR231_006041 [Phyllobacterium sp. LjRoot231]|uniref:hypothetical protein n=1 Tax=Phyllobacterium sp. LjRoot231 TaxID=3342289 RepID=UPI003ECF9D17